MSAPRLVPLPALLDMRTVDLTRDVFSDAFEQGGVTVDVTPVERIATVGFHLLMCLARSARTHGVPFVLKGESPAFSLAAQQLGLCNMVAGWRNVATETEPSDQ